jgi:hypothetical protein
MSNPILPREKTGSAWKPQRIFIEIVGHCNARCPYCPSGRAIKRSKHVLAPDRLEALVLHLRGLGLLVRRICLYNYGEPFLHPELSRILAVLKANKLKADLSSNFILNPRLDEDSLSAIGSVGISLSGMSRSSYGRIHGARLERVLEHFDRFRERLRAARLDVQAFCFWRRYRFNLHEEEHARNYFESRGVRFLANPAHPGDVSLFLWALSGEDAAPGEDRPPPGPGDASCMEGDRIRSDLLWEEIRERAAVLAAAHPGYVCRQHEILAINENGRLLGCCGLTVDHPEYDQGEVLEMNVNEMLERKRSLRVCLECVRLGVAQYLHMRKTTGRPATGQESTRGA